MTTATATRERPILFSDPMTLALMDGRKTQTRRVVTHLLGFGQVTEFQPSDTPGAAWTFRDRRERWHDLTHADLLERCPYGQPGDRLYVREAWQYADWTEEGEPYIRYRADGKEMLCDEFPIEWVDRLWNVWEELSSPENRAIDNISADRRWRPAMLMPRWASRITLELTDVRVERLQDVSIEDILAEGIGREDDEANIGQYWREATGARFVMLWDSINHSRGYGWDVNPWVWALAFRRIGA